MHSRRTHLALSLILTTAAVALSTTAVFGGKPPPRNATAVDFLVAPSTPPCPELAEITGIYQDGLGTYQYGAWTKGSFMFHPPACAEGREVFALLPSEATSQMTPGDFGTCSGSSLNTPMLIIPSLLNAQTGVVDQNAGQTGVRYSFHIDSDGDGYFETPANIIWHAGIHLTRMELPNPNRTVYQVTTGPTSDYAEVRSAGASLGTFCIPLRLTVTRLK